MPKGYIHFSLAELRKVLQLPEGVDICAIQPNLLYQSVQIIVEHPDITAVPELGHLNKVYPDYEWRTDLDQQEWRRLQSVRNMNGSHLE